MSSPAFMPFYVADYLGDTMHLTVDQHGAYLLLIFAYWRNGGPLPDDDQFLEGVTKCSSHFFKKKLRPVLEKFFVVSDGLWTHKRIEIELKQASDIREARRKAGRKGNAKRWQGDPRARDLQPQPQSYADAPPINDPPVTGAVDERRRRATRLPVDWEPDAADCRFAGELGLDPVQVTAEFRDYWQALPPGRRATRLDWHATYRNACRIFASRYRGGNGVQRSGKHRQAAPGFSTALRRAFADAADEHLG